jgi:hypothetical protein
MAPICLAHMQPAHCRVAPYSSLLSHTIANFISENTEFTDTQQMRSYVRLSKIGRTPDHSNVYGIILATPVDAKEFASKLGSQLVLTTTRV